MSTPELPDDYPALFAAIKAEVATARLRARVAVNNELIGLYWKIGRLILERQARQGWGAKVITRLADDLRAEYPDMTGWSRSNLHYMRRLAEAWSAFVPQPVGQMPWGSVRALLDGLDSQDLRDWYAQEAVTNGWSRAVLEHQIRTHLHARTGAAPSNFAAALPREDSDLATKLLRDPYHLGFLGLASEASERELEDAVATHIVDFLLALGEGFAFVGRQVHLEVGGADFYVDLLFFNYRHRRFVVIELKAVAFRPEYLGKLGFYVAVVDDCYRSPGDRPTVGILLCRAKNETVVRYSLGSQATPVAVAEFTDLDLPDDLRHELPGIDRLASEVQRIDERYAQRPADEGCPTPTD